MTLRRTSASRYEITSSSLYRLPTVRALARCLLWEGTPSALRALSRRQDNFREFERINPASGKRRKIQAPNDMVKPLQARLNSLLKQIKVPDYLQSGIPGRSHLTNSREHMESEGATATIDISDFYPSISRTRVFRFFRKVLQCKSDVADVLADLVCYNGHLATGSPTSVLLSFFACKDMFDAIAERARKKGVTFTLYVDDIALTGNCISYSDIRACERTLRLFGFFAKKEKAKIFRKRDAKVVTGRAFRAGVSRAPNKKHQELHHTMQKLRGGGASGNTKRRAIGQLENVGMLDEKIGSQLRVVASKIRATLPPRVKKRI